MKIIHSLMILLILSFPVLTFAENSFFQSKNEESFDSDDLDKINEFCIKFKEDLLKDFNVIDSDSVSKETFYKFEMLSGDILKPGLLEFFKRLEKMGANDCKFFYDY